MRSRSREVEVVELRQRSKGTCLSAARVVESGKWLVSAPQHDCDQRERWCQETRLRRSLSSDLTLSIRNHLSLIIILSLQELGQLGVHQAEASPRLLT